MIITVTLIAIAVISYALGNINGAIITSTHFFHRDIRSVGSGNAGLANFYRNFGIKGLAMVFGIDVAKGFITAWLGGFLLGLTGEGETYRAAGALFAAFCCCLGHIYPVAYQFHGGKAILCTAAGIFAVDWRAGLACILVFIVVVAISRFVSLGSVLATVTFPISIWALDYGWLPSLLALFTAAIVLFKHRENIMRIIRHKEPKFEFKKDVTHKLDEDI